MIDTLKTRTNSHHSDEYSVRKIHRIALSVSDRTDFISLIGYNIIITLPLFFPF